MNRKLLVILTVGATIWTLNLLEELLGHRDVDFATVVLCLASWAGVWWVCRELKRESP